MSELENKILIIRKNFNIEDLYNHYPPQITNRNKKIIFQIACPEDGDYSGEITFSRWEALDISDLIFNPNIGSTNLLMEENTYQYKPFEAKKEKETTIEWYVNFADYHLFKYYGSNLFAQDEIQVAEHPVLGSLREILLTLEKNDDKLGPYTRDVDKNPTPILIRGARRRIKVSVDKYNLYGGNFSRARSDIIKKACDPIIPPTISNIIAMEAPKGYYGKKYSIETLKEIFITAYTAFLAAKIESFYETPPPSFIIIHTGNWGTGVYGGNKTLMALMQILSAFTVNIDYLVYHTYDSFSSEKYREARDIFKNTFIKNQKSIPIEDALKIIEKMDFHWGESDGN
jgi:hypothetical protein